MEKRIHIAVQGAMTLTLDQLHAFQGDLKTLSEARGAQLRKEIIETGFAFTPHVWMDPADQKYYLLDGHQRFAVLNKLSEDGYGIPPIPVSIVQAGSVHEAKRRILQATSQYGEMNKEGLYNFMLQNDIPLMDVQSSFQLPGIDMAEFSQMFDQGKVVDVSGHTRVIGPPGEAPTLAQRFLVPPFSILDARQGYWRARKEQWLSLGIKSEEGRMENLLGMSDTILQPDPLKRQGMAIPTSKEMIPNYYKLRDSGMSDEDIIAQHMESETTFSKGTSIFDPVLCELAYRWFSKEGAIVLDPFAGGSVRGVVASKLSRKYIGIELRKEQVDANIDQAKQICAGSETIPMWKCGDSTDIGELCQGVEADLIFSCPPYADLEVYSDDPRDISNMTYEEFMKAYRLIIERTCFRLKQDRFAVWVIGDIREKNKNGFYRNFVSDTIDAFQDAGLHFYNDAILVTPAGNLAMRAGRQFVSSRKLGKSHQNVLVFCKGDPWEAVKACGEIQIEDILPPAAVDGAILVDPAVALGGEI